MTSDRRTPTLILCRGLPGSGKSWWAQEQVMASGGQVKRINRDTLRAMLDNGAHSARQESLIIQAEQELARLFLRQGFDVIIDDTNLSQSIQDLWRTYATRTLGVRYTVQDFTTVSLSVCLARNAQREHPVPDDYIKRMWAKWLAVVEIPEGVPEGVG